MTTKSTTRPRGRPPRAAGSPVYRRECEQIRYGDAANFSAALHFARETLEREPNRHITIQWRHAPSDRPIPERLRRVLNNTGVFLRRRTGKAAVWAYSREVGKLKGEHVHILLHVPNALWPAYCRQLRHWLELETGEPVRESAVKPVTITPGDLQRVLKSYLLKEGSEEVRIRWVDRQRHKPTGGVVEGKRLKVSHSIGPSARRALSQIA